MFCKVTLHHMVYNYILILMPTVVHENVHLDSQVWNFMVYHNLVIDTP